MTLLCMKFYLEKRIGRKFNFIDKLYLSDCFQNIILKIESQKDSIITKRENYSYLNNIKNRNKTILLHNTQKKENDPFWLNIKKRNIKEDPKINLAVKEYNIIIEREKNTEIIPIEDYEWKDVKRFFFV